VNGNATWNTVASLLMLAINFSLITC